MRMVIVEDSMDYIYIYYIYIHIWVLYGLYMGSIWIMASICPDVLQFQAWREKQVKINLSLKRVGQPRFTTRRCYAGFLGSRIPIFMLHDIVHDMIWFIWFTWLLIWSPDFFS